MTGNHIPNEAGKEKTKIFVVKPDVLSPGGGEFGLTDRAMRIHRGTGPRRESTEKVPDFGAPSQREKMGEILGRSKEKHPTSSQAGTRVERTGVRKMDKD